MYHAGVPKVRYVALTTRQNLQRIQAIVGRLGQVVQVTSASDLLEAMRNPVESCVVVEPALLTPAAASALVQQAMSGSLPVVVYAWMVRESFEASIIIAQGIPAEFVFQGVPDELSALRRALLLAPDAGLGRAVNRALEARLAALPPQLRLTVENLLGGGNGPQTAEELAAQGGIAHRSMDRAFALAGLESSRFVISAAHVIRAYRAVAWSRIPFRAIAAMAGYASQRTLDHHFIAFLGRSSTALRKQPLSMDEVVTRVVQRLTLRASSAQPRRGRAQHPHASEHARDHAPDTAPDHASHAESHSFARS